MTQGQGLDTVRAVPFVDFIMFDQQMQNMLTILVSDSTATGFDGCT